MATIRVKTDFKTISQAVAAARPGDSIIIENGFYCETVTIDKNNISLIGGAKTIINGAFSLRCAFIISNAEKTRLESLKIINFSESGVFIGGGAENALIKCVISDCLGCGAAIQNARGSLVAGCEFSGNGEFGLYAPGSNGLRAEKNKASSCRSGGVFVESTGINPVLIRNNELRSNLGDGLFVGGRGPTVICNICDSNFGNGITAASGEECAIIENTVSGNSKSGIISESGPATLLKNRVISNGRSGIIIFKGSVLRDNIIHGNGCYGLAVYGTKNTIENNQITDNGFYDILRARPDNSFLKNLYRTSNPRHLNSHCPCV